ncbi:MAG: DUF1648 domain-containing protein [Firmicutes bacterium]|nr:DUF1648 domain-containing protein [Bacillota bacterium]
MNRQATVGVGAWFTGDGLGSLLLLAVVLAVVSFFLSRAFRRHDESLRLGWIFAALPSLPLLVAVWLLTFGANPAGGGEGALQEAPVVTSMAVTGLAVLAQLFMARAYAPRLPEQMTTHWGLDGRPNGAKSRASALRIGPTVALAFGAVALVVSLGGWVGVISMTIPQIIFLLIVLFLYRFNSTGR